MSDLISIRLMGLRDLYAQVDRITPAIQDRLRVFMAAFTIDFREQVKANIADRFKSTGPLYQGVQAEMTEEPSLITSRVFIEDVPYAAIQEFGGRTSPHDILPRNAKMLAFMMPSSLGFSSGDVSNQMVFAKAVHHPGSVMPERTYARLALVQLRSAFDGGMREVVSAGVSDAMDSSTSGGE